jgi:D-alanyl-D-alanine carboxypeptidase
MNTVKSILLILMPIWLVLVSDVSYGRHAAIIIDADDGSILHEVDATHSWYPASLTKVMTLYMTFEALNSGQIDLYDTLRTSYHASRQPNSKLGLRQGETLTVQDAILAVITRSANDAAVVLAEHLGGTEESFAVKMTTKAHALGMYDTHFMNATGLPHQWQVTTSRDMALLAWKIQRNFPTYYPYFSAHNFNYKGRELRGINKFTAKYPGAEGMKTGFTCGSGYNLISTASQNGRHLIGVILGGMTSSERYQLMTNMMDDGFANKYNASPSRNINSISTHFTGTPPYQLGCGKMASTNTAYGHGDEADRNKGQHIGKSKRASKSRYKSNRKNVKKSRSVSKTANKTKSANKRKSKSKSSSSASKSKTASKNKKIHKAKSTAKSKSGTNKSKSSKTRYRHS